MRTFIATLPLAGAFLLVLSGVTSRSARADHCPDWARTCVHPFEAVAPATARRGRADRHVGRRSVSTAGMPAPLVTAIEDVKRQCPGFRVTSGYRPSARVRGSGRPSLHASNRAADIAGGEANCAAADLMGRDLPAGGDLDVNGAHCHAPAFTMFMATKAESMGRSGSASISVRLLRATRRRS